jgi:tRNA-uridine 2-sulfurtransferase
VTNAGAATVRLGDEAALASRGAELDDLLCAPGISLPRKARVRIRYRHEGAFGTVEGEAGGRGTIAFDAPVRAVSRGQIAVFYDGDRVLGGGRIARACA